MENTNNHGHVPVLRERVTELLAPALCNTTTNPPIILDATLGAGGHSEYFLTTFPRVNIIGLDRDTTALAQAATRLADFGDRITTLHTRFDDFPTAIQAAADAGNATCQAALTEGISGALFDLGVSSMQLDQVNRGFAYRVDAPLDMRMNNSEGITAAEILNTYPHGDLTRILKTYGDERFASKIATAIIREREHAPFTTSARLVELLYNTIPAATRRTGGHPAKRTFQALRIEVNQELAAITNVLPRIADALIPGGRAVFMAYQSLEDKIIKKYFAEITTSKTPRGLPMELPEYAAKFRLVTRGAEKATPAEIADNSRAAPVRVRAIEKLATSTNRKETSK